MIQRLLTEEGSGHSDLSRGRLGRLRTLPVESDTPAGVRSGARRGRGGSRRRPPAMAPIGSLLILHNQALALLPQFYLSSALIVGGYKQEQQLWRQAQLRATLVAIVLEVAWSGLHPQALSRHHAAGALVGAVLLNVLHLCTIYGQSPLEYTSELALVLHLARLILLIPVNQIGNVWTLEAGTEQSQARWRIGGWIATVALGLLVLLVPALGQSPCCVIATVSLPSTVMLKVLYDRDGTEVSSSSLRQKDEGDSDAIPARVSVAKATIFLMGACVLGTNGEAMLDSAVGLAVRQSLVRGNSELALANQTAVLASMVLALLSEVVILKDSDTASRSSMYIMLWVGVQLVRSAGFGYLTDDFQGAVLVWAFVFVDKYTGPLGNAAVETSLLATLKGSSADREPRKAADRWVAWTVPGAMLLTVRQVVESSSRPFFELLLTPPTDVANAVPVASSTATNEQSTGHMGAGNHWPLPFEWVVLALTGGTAIFVRLTMRRAFRASKPKRE